MHIKFILRRYISSAKSRESKTLLTNFSYLSLLQIAGYVFPLITMPYLARVLGTDGFGKIAFASAVVIWFQTISDWGFSFTATRDIAQQKDNKELISHIFSDVLWSRITLAIACFLILLLMIIIMPAFRENMNILLITYLLIPGHIFFPEWFFQALERMKYITIFNIISKLIFTIGVFVFVQNTDDYIMQPLLVSLGYTVCGVASMWLIIKKWKYRIYLPTIPSIIKTLKNSFDVFLNTIMPNFYNSFSIIILGIFAGNYANGIYDGGNKITSVCHQFQSVLSRTFFPFLSRKLEKHRIFSFINLTATIILSILLFAFAPYIIHIMLSPQFDDSINVLRILSISMIFTSMTNIYGTNYLIIIHKEKTLRDITIIASITGMLIAIPLVYHYTYIGAALTICLCRGLMGIPTYIVAKKIMVKA